ncbi:MAG: type II toxin-antitoxin system RelE/ParE family toxin [Coriobacteriia bacterium]
MAKRFEVTFAESASDDLQEILDWYAAQLVPEVGERLVAGVVSRAEQLEEFPDRGKVVPEFDTPWLRELEYPPFRIVYRRDHDHVRIVRVWRGERLMDEPLAETPKQR